LLNTLIGLRINATTTAALEKLMRRIFHPLLVGAIVLHALLLSACDNGLPPARIPPPQVTYSVGGSVSGLASGASVVLQNNGGNTTTVSTNGSFHFSTQLVGYTPYAVTVLTQPTGQVCAVNAANGTLTEADVTSVQVECTTNTYTISGSVSGLTSGAHVILQVNGSDSTTVSANGSFSFPTPIPYNTSYAVAVLTQPTGLTCTVSAGSGTVNLSNVAGVLIACATSLYTISGTVSGLSNGAQVTVQNNGADSITVVANGPFGFLTAIPYNGSYVVTVLVQPPALTCIVSGGSGPHITANVSVSITCSPATETVLYSFQSGTADGAYPTATVIQGSDGNFYGTTDTGGTANQGTMFRITPLGVETVLYSFGNGTDGQVPEGTLIQGSDGNFYGTTGYGGTDGLGTVFKITPAGIETVLHSFGGGGDGIVPFVGLVQGSDGNFYGTTGFGGSANRGTVFKITPAGVETVLHSFGSGTDGQILGAALIQGSDGNFYGVTQNGGTAASGTVFKITPLGVETVLYSFGSGGATDGTFPLGGLIQGSDGNFYGTTGSVGTQNTGTVFRITPAGVETILHTFGSGTDGAIPEGQLIQGSDGNFYGTTASGGTADSGTIFKMTPLGVETVLHSFGNGTDGATPEASLIQGSDGNFYGTTGNGGTAGFGTVFRF
jgi:uncharacterized repeat protein (TIGR03803 family)